MIKHIKKIVAINYFLILLSAFFTPIGSFGMELYSSKNESLQYALNFATDNINQPLFKSNHENIYELMLALTKQIDGSKNKIRAFYRILKNENLTVNQFLNRFFEKNKIDFIAAAQGDASSAEKELRSIKPMAYVNLGESKFEFLDDFPEKTKKLFTQVIKHDKWFEITFRSISRLNHSNTPQ